MHTNKRKLIELEQFDVVHLNNLMRKLFPKNNDCASLIELIEVQGELDYFGIVNKKQLRLFLKKYRRWLLDIDNEPMDLLNQRIYREELGDKDFYDTVRRHYWFCYPALIRNAMGEEFGKAYEEYSAKRDEI